MAIEANAEVIQRRAERLYVQADRLSGILNRFMDVRAQLLAIGQPMTVQQKSAALTAATQAVADVASAASDLQAAWTANSPV